jgi:hypothetical protein
MEESSFFNDVDGDRIYYAEDFAEYFIPFFTNGIFNNGCQVLGNTNDMAVNVSTGRAFINGYRYRNKQSKTLTIENADGVLNRIDNIVIRLDLTNRNISTQVIKGSFLNNPVAPDLTRTSTIYDLRIAKVYIPAGTTEITQDLIEDCRFINSDCGNVISPIKTPDTEQLFIQMQAIFDKFIADSTNGFDTWFDSIKNQLDSDAAGNLQNQINNLNSNKVDNAKFDLDSNNLQLLANGKNVGDSVHIPTGITDTATGEEDLKIINNKGVVKFSLDGKTEQKTYTGKNILDYVSNLKASSDGLTSVINDDGSITTSGKPSSNYRTILNSINIIDFLEDGETYTFSQSKANDKLYMQMNAKKKDGTYSYYSLNDSTKSKQEIIVNKSIYETYTLNIQTGLTSDWGDSPLTITNKYMLCKGTDTAATSFETYVGGQASPNPDYPQEIKNIKGVENIWFGGESTTNNGITFTKNNDGSYDITGTAIASADCINLVNIANAKLKNGINYNLSINKLTNEKVSILTEAYIENWDSHVIGPLITSTTLSTNKIINIKDNITRVRYVIRVEKGQTVNIKGLKIQLEEGTVVHDFVPNGSNYLKLVDRTENLIGLDNKQYRVNLKKGDKILAVNNGTTNLNLNLYTNYGDTARNDFFTIAANSQRSIVIANDSRAIAWGGTLNNIAWVVKGDKFIPYEPYKSQTINIDLKDNELCSDKEQTLKDELVIENGRAKINKKFGEYIFTGNETFSFADSNARIKTDSNLLPQLANVYIQKAQNADNITHLFCTHYAVDSQNKIIKNSNKIGFSQWDNKKYIYFPADYSTIEEFKAKLKSLYDAGTPVIIQYPLAEPQIIDLGEVDFDLIEGNSTLNLEEDLKSNMSIKYYTDSTVVDLKKKVENKQNVILHGTTIPSNDLGEDGDIYLQHN